MFFIGRCHDTENTNGDLVFFINDQNLLSALIYILHMIRVLSRPIYMDILRYSILSSLPQTELKKYKFEQDVECLKHVFHFKYYKDEERGEKEKGKKKKERKKKEP